MKPNEGPRWRKQAEEWAARLPDLRAQALRIAATVAIGGHGRRRAGAGDSFWQFRNYREGDAIRAIDWRRSAKMADRLYVREREWETAESFWFWLDQSPSMAFAGTGAREEKRERAAVLTLALAALLLRSGERVGLLDSGDTKPLGQSPAVLHRMTDRMAREEHVESLPPLANLPKYSTVVVLSDGWQPLDKWAKRLAAIAAPGVQGHFIQIVDPAEAKLDLRGRVRLEGLEQEGELLLRRAEDLVDAYQERFRGHINGLSALCRRRGWSYRLHSTDQPPMPLLLAMHQTIGLGRRAAIA